MGEPAGPLPIPVLCARRPTTPDGLVIPYGNVQLADGGCDFRSHHHVRWKACWERSVCQVCGGRIGQPIVMLCGPRQLAELVFDEPPLHPQCARYVARACPMVAGERPRYRTGPSLAHRSRGGRCPVPGCDCGGWVPTPGIRSGPGGDPAHEWYAVYLTGYQVAGHPDGTLVGGISRPSEVRKVLLVSEPGAALTPWRPVPDWAERYQPPATDPVSHQAGYSRASAP